MLEAAAERGAAGEAARRPSRHGTERLETVIVGGQASHIAYHVVAPAISNGDAGKVA